MVKHKRIIDGPTDKLAKIILNGIIEVPIDLETCPVEGAIKEAI